MLPAPNRSGSSSWQATSFPNFSAPGYNLAPPMRRIVRTPVPPLSGRPSSHRHVTLAKQKPNRRCSFQTRNLKRSIRSLSSSSLLNCSRSVIELISPFLLLALAALPLAQRNKLPVFALRNPVKLVPDYAAIYVNISRQRLYPILVQRPYINVDNILDIFLHLGCLTI